MYRESVHPRRTTEGASGRFSHPWEGAIRARTAKALDKRLPISHATDLRDVVVAEVKSHVRHIISTAIAGVDTAIGLDAAASDDPAASESRRPPDSTPPATSRPRPSLLEASPDADAATEAAPAPEPAPETEHGAAPPEFGDADVADSDTHRRPPPPSKAQRCLTFLQSSPSRRLHDHPEVNRIAHEIVDEAAGSETGRSTVLIDRLVDGVFTAVDAFLRVNVQTPIVDTATKMDEKLNNYLQYLLAKAAEAEKPLSAIDLEKEERRQKQKKANDDLLADNSRIFGLYNELVCAKEVLSTLHAQRKSMAMQYSRPDGDVGDVVDFPPIVDDVTATPAVSGGYDLASMSVHGLSDDGSDSGGSDDDDGASTASTSTLSADHVTTERVPIDVKK